MSLTAKLVGSWRTLLIKKVTYRGHWTEAHVYYSGYTESQLRPLAEILLQNCRNAESNHKAIFEKYKNVATEGPQHLFKNTLKLLNSYKSEYIIEDHLYIIVH